MSRCSMPALDAAPDRRGLTVPIVVARVAAGLSIGILGAGVSGDQALDPAASP